MVPYRVIVAIMKMRSCRVAETRPRRMSSEPPLPTFLETLRRSQLFDSATLQRWIAEKNSLSSQQLADQLIAAGELTHYQAEKLLRGRADGWVIGPYVVLAPLGRGGMGTVVYLARDRRAAQALGDTAFVALKLLPRRKALENPRALARLRREGALGARVRHPHVVRTLSYREEANVYCLALEFIPGQTLRERVLRRGPLPVAEASRIFADVAAGLAHLHDHGLIHRDVKPANIMIRPDGPAVLLDLGLAMALGEPLPNDPSIAGGPGYTVGTMDFIAPEQAINAVAVGPAADLYSLGGALYYALTGTVPFPASDSKSKILRHHRDPVPIIPHIPAAINQLIQQLMAKSPSDRPPSALAVQQWLLPWAGAIHPGPAINPVALADAPGIDETLWETAPGDEPAACRESDSPSSFECGNSPSCSETDWPARVSESPWAFLLIMSCILALAGSLMVIFRFLR